MVKRVWKKYRNHKILKKYIFFENPTINRKYFFNVFNTVMPGGVDQLLKLIKEAKLKKRKRYVPEAKVSKQY